MENIFDTNKLYPDYNDHLKGYFKDHFDSVFVAFPPFFKMTGKGDEVADVQSRKIVSLEEFQQTEGEIFENIEPSENRIIYVNNSKYPIEEEIVEKGVAISWAYLIDQQVLNNVAEINMALLTSIGALRPKFCKPDLLAELSKFTIDNAIYHPSEGRINTFDLLRIYNCLRDTGKHELVMSDEFFEQRETVNLAELGFKEFLQRIIRHVYFFPTDRSLLFSIDWDSFFFLICADEVLLNEIIPKYGFEGFYCDEETDHWWALDKKLR